ncbi:MAG TPA: hypothetical protein VMN81_08140 [Vicinamibacterales bacterium]|nr:hypothetical protein [Vicinamibacterales bacterium]
MLRQFQFQFAVLALMLVSACAGGTPPPETSPMVTTGVVGGTVKMSIVPGAAVPSVLVSVAGTTLTANVSRLGDFVLANVPEGPLELRFTGEEIAAILPLGTLAGGETVSVAVRLTPAEAAVASMSRMRGAEALVEGVIEEPSTPLPPNTIIVGGRIVILPSGTPVRGADGAGITAALKPGMRVRVIGTVGAAGVTARELVIL